MISSFCLTLFILCFSLMSSCVFLFSAFFAKMSGEKRHQMDKGALLIMGILSVMTFIASLFLFNAN